MIGRLTKIIICTGAITWMVADEAPTPAGVDGLIAKAREVTMAEAKSFCAAQPARCGEMLRSAIALEAAMRPSRDTLTAADRAAQPRAHGG